MKEITAEDEFTQAKLAESGLAYTLAKHPPFLDVITPYMGANPYEDGVRVPAGDGRFAAASRDDLAAAQAAILTQGGTCREDVRPDRGAVRLLRRDRGDPLRHPRR
jgi:NAD(P)H dehydrogenase (quinone)